MADHGPTSMIAQNMNRASESESAGDNDNDHDARGAGGSDRVLPRPATAGRQVFGRTGVSGPPHARRDQRDDQRQLEPDLAQRRGTGASRNSELAGPARGDDGAAAHGQARSGVRGAGGPQQVRPGVVPARNTGQLPGSAEADSERRGQVFQIF